MAKTTQTLPLEGGSMTVTLSGKTPSRGRPWLVSITGPTDTVVAMQRLRSVVAQQAKLVTDWLDT